MKNLSSKLKDNILPIYKELFEQNTFKDICTFTLQWGENFPQDKNKGILFVGKSVNGWITDDKNVENLFDKENPNRIFEREDQMKWVDDFSGNIKGYNTNKSAFWRLIREIAHHYYPKKWYSHIAWTNLYKIAPWEGGNPSSQLQNQQQSYCFKLLKKEINILSPAYVIMLTSGWEEPFIEEIKKEETVKVISEKEWDSYKSTLLKIGNIKYIISPHPQGKVEEKHKNAIIQLLKTM